MNSIVSKKDFPSAGSFVYLNAANVGLMYSEAEKVIKEWHTMEAIILMKMLKSVCLKNYILQQRR